MWSYLTIIDSNLKIAYSIDLKDDKLIKSDISDKIDWSAYE